MKHSGKEHYFHCSLALLAVATGLACLAVSQQPRESAGPLVLSPAVVDFGTVRRGDLDGEFELTNDSDQAVQILHVVVSCACEKVVVRHIDTTHGSDLSAPAENKGRVPQRAWLDNLRRQRS